MKKADPAGDAADQEFYRLIDTDLGSIGIAWTARGLTRLQLPEGTRTATEQRTGSRDARHWPGALPDAIARLGDDLRRYASGARVDFADVRVDLSTAPPFHRRVYAEARTLKWGETASYGELAERIGSPGAARAVGQALSRNPAAIIVPCHRVLASGRKIGGFTAFGGRVTKQRLLALEGASVKQPANPFAAAESPRRKQREFRANR